MSEIIFELKEVFYSYLSRFPALCGIDLQIRKGEKIAVIGANGTGKSTLLQLLDGLIFPDEGSVRAFGVELSEKAFEDEAFSLDFRQKVGFVFQNPEVQLFCPSVKEDIVFGPLQLGVRPEQIKKRLEAISIDLGIKDLLERAPHHLSIGEKRKVAIASVLAIDPEVIILDEPTAGLDPLTSRHIIDIILAANKAGKTIIISTHDLHIVEEIADKVYVFSHERKIVKSGTPAEILEDASLLEANNLVHIHAHQHKNIIHVHPHRHADHHPED